MKFIRSTLCALSCLFILSGSAFADIEYTLTAGTDKISFSLPELPAVQSSCDFFGDTSCFAVFPVSLTVDGSPIIGNVSFYRPSVGGGLTICTGATCTAGSVLVNNDGPGDEQLFTGSLASPELESFSDLQLAVANPGSPLYNEAFLLNATATGSTATPEPGSPATLILALGAIMLVVRSRHTKQWR